MFQQIQLKLFVISLLLFFFSIRNIYSQNNKSCHVKNSSTYDGELINYSVYYTFAGVYVPAGEASFSTTYNNNKGNPAFYLTGKGSTYSSYDWFFKVRDFYESIVDTATMLPFQFIRNISEGKNKLNSKTIFDRKEKSATYNTTKISISECTHDVLSMIYYARNIDYTQSKAGDMIPYDLYLDGKVYSLYMRFMGKQVVKTKYGTFSCFIIKPKLIEGTIFRGGEEMTVYVSDDKRKIPIYIETPIIVGKIKVYYIPN